MVGPIVPGRVWGDPRAQALAANQRAAQLRAAAMRGATPVANGGTVPHHAGPPHMTGWYGPEWAQGLSPEEHARMRARFESFQPRLIGGGRGLGAYTGARDFFKDILPPGGELSPGAGASYAAMRGGPGRTAAMSRQGFGDPSGGGGAYYQTQTPYQPEFADPSRQSYPVHRNLMNNYARMFYKTHPIIGTGVDLYSELPWCDVQFVGEGVDGEVRDTYELTWETCRIRPLLPFITRERTVLGEAGLHAFYNDAIGAWSYVGMHNPDHLEVIWSPVIKMDPIVRYQPDSRLRQILNSGSPALAAVRDSIPPQILNAIASGQAIELHNLNFTFLARKSHPYDVRGTSILSRLWRDVMLEDALYNTSIAIARRAGAPIRVAKLGDAATGWIPEPEKEQALLGLLAQAEMDPAAWLVYNYGLQLEAFGSQERAWKVEQSGEYIERRLLIGLGISRAFIQGEVSFASAATGLTVFLQRLLAERETVENEWIIPKFLRPLAVMNGWVKPTSAELSHKVRVRRSQRELLEDRRYIVPKLQWARALDPSVDQAKITAVQALQGLGVRFSKQYLGSLVGVDWEEQLEQSATEAAHEAKVIAEDPAMAAASGGAGDGGGMLPGIPPGDLGFGGPPPEGDLGLPPGEDLGLPPPGLDEGGEPPPAPEAGAHADRGDVTTPGGAGRADEQAVSAGEWPREMLLELAAIFEHDAEPESDLWRAFVQERPEAYNTSGPKDFRAEVSDWLLSQSTYAPEAIRTLDTWLASRWKTKQS